MFSRNLRQLTPLVILMAITLLLSCGDDSLSYRNAIPAEPVIGPKLSISDPFFDFGQVPQNSTVSARFYLRSTGDDDLRIDKINTGCGCIKAQWDTDTIAPGEAVMLEIFFETKSYSGKQVKAINIYSNADTAGTYQTVKISANVISAVHKIVPVTPIPNKFDLSPFGVVSLDEFKFYLFNVSQQRVRLCEVIYPTDLFALTLPEVINASDVELHLPEYYEGSYYVTGLLQLTEKGQSNNFESSITIEANDVYHTRLTIPVRRQIR